MAEVPRSVTMEKRDLALADGRFCYLQDLTKGNIRTYVGPIVVNQTGQEMPVVYDPATGKFNETETLREAVQGCVEAEEGDYLILKNPSKDGKHPDTGGVAVAATLDIGRQVVIAGPVRFPLWPAQQAELVKGHHLRSNQYLLIRVVNEEEARRNWSKAVMKTATPTVVPEGQPPKPPEGETHSPTIVSESAPIDLAVGKQYLIRGTDVSFFIPPTGIIVLRDEDTEEYVREAETLERLEFAVLVDENGTKRYERGPQVVFPKPTEDFITDKNNRNQRKSRAIELNPIQGIHIKVIADYSENNRDYKEGEELFITGKDTAIYFPREEHSILTYDGKQKHFATAIPAGEGRYVMHRMSGDIRTVRGPAMLLPDPRTEVIIKRPLTDLQCQTWYPGNEEALAFNRALREAAKRSPTTRAGTVSEGDYERYANSNVALNSNVSTGFDRVEEAAFAASAAPTASKGKRIAGMDKSMANSDRNAMIADQFSRATQYSQPRTLILDTRYEGVPRIGIWTGYSVQVVNSKGERRVEEGPKNLLLEYDEELEILSLSHGKPKTTDQLLKTAYLRVLNNKISDVIEVETKDHVKCSVYLSYSVNFEGDPAKWFEIANYVKWLCDHSRSLLKAHAKQHTVEAFYADHTRIIRDLLLGPKDEKNGRPGMPFKENGMRMLECEVLKVSISDPEIANLLSAGQREVVESNIKLSSLQRLLDFTKREELIKQEEEAARFQTAQVKAKIEVDRVNNDLSVTLAKIEAEIRQYQDRQASEEEKQKGLDVSHQAGLRRDKAKQEQEQEFLQVVHERKLIELVAETKAVTDKFSAAQGGFSEALLTLGNQDMLARISEALSVQNFVGGKNFTDVVGKVFGEGPLKNMVDRITGQATKQLNGNIATKLPSPPA